MTVTCGRHSTCSRPKIRPLQLTALQYLRRALTPHPATYTRASLVAQMVKKLPVMWETWVWSLSQEDRLEKGMATHSSILACRIPWTEEPGRLQSKESQRVRRDWATNTTHPYSSPFHVNIQNAFSKVIYRFLIALLKATAAVTHKVHECFLVEIFNVTDKQEDFCSSLSFGPLFQREFLLSILCVCV